MRRCLSALLALAALAAGESPAQVTDARLQATRAELEAVAKAGGSEASRSAARLRDGDLFPGDRVVITVVNEAQLSDTFAVTPARTLELPQLAPLPVAGLLRSELGAAVTAHVARYVREPSVTVRPLIRVLVNGAVLRPGVVSVPADALVSDIFTAAGGLAGDANLTKSKMRRDGAVLYDEQGFAKLIGTGQSLDRAGLRGGDALEVAQRVPGGSSARILPIIGVVTGALTAVALLLN